MADVYYTRVVRREDLGSPRSSPEPSERDEQLESLLQQNLARSFGIYEERGVPHDFGDGDIKGNTSETPGEYNFQLFSRSVGNIQNGSKVADDSHRKVVLGSPTPENRESGFLVPERPNDHYFVGPSSKKRRAEIASVALTGEEVMGLSERKNPGLTFSWRVTTVTIKPSSKIRLATDSQHSEGRRRPGKKRRIILRKRVSEQQKRQQQQNLTQAEKTTAEREKRTRRNREKKVKKKEKEKLKKAGIGGASQEELAHAKPEK
ncbi:MAG: hypothetical protein M1837_002475 [Sclerophora amabilis]|nr:MAG: hypothetical protein M1837_002475 [Sclerophora amabilis]